MDASGVRLGVVWLAAWALLGGLALADGGGGGEAYGEQGDWRGHERRTFQVGGREGFVTLPAISAPGRPWIWRTSFPDFHPEVDLELLRRGWAVGYLGVVDLLGSDGALDLMDAYYELVTGEAFGLAARPAMEAVSRGGLHAYRYAARHPGRVACLYADTPVMDLKSWPLGWEGAGREVGQALEAYGFAGVDELRAFRGNPLDLLDKVAEMALPLRHVISLNDRVVPPEANSLEAARRLGALGHEMELVVVEEGTEASQGHHFELPEVFGSARFVMRHSHVLPEGREYFALRRGLGTSRAKFEAGGRGRVAFLGGSITANPGWRDEVMRYLGERFPEVEFEFVAAGVASMGSVPHAFRLGRDVLAGGEVDLIFVEAAVNDHNHDGDEAAEALVLRGMEGVVRQLREACPEADVVLMHFVHDLHLASYGRGEVPHTVAIHEKVAEHYGCPSLDLSREVCARIRAGELTWEGDFRDLHPSPYGQQLYANSITRMLDTAWLGELEEGLVAGGGAVPVALDPASYGRGRFGELGSVERVRGFELVDKWRPEDGAGTRAGYVDVVALVGEGEGAECVVRFEGTACGFLVASGPDAGTVEVSLDGGEWRRVEVRTKWSGRLHLPWAVILADGLEEGQHELRVRVVEGVLRVLEVLEN